MFVHLLADIAAIAVVKWDYVLWNRWCDGRIYRWVYLLSLLELVVYFIGIALNGFLDRLTVDLWYVKPVFVALELILFILFILKEIGDVSGVKYKNKAK